MKRNSTKKRINNPEELNTYLQSTKPITWIILFAVTISLVALFVLSFTIDITYTVSGIAHIDNTVATLEIRERDLSKLEVGQKVYINSIEGQIEDIKEDGYPTLSSFNLNNGDYNYKIIIKKIKPIEYLTNK